jgi:hypothetical protein
MAKSLLRQVAVKLFIEQTGFEQKGLIALMQVM